MEFRFRTGIQKKQLACVKRVDESVVMKHLALSSGDGGKGERLSMTGGHCCHCCGYLRFFHAMTGHAVGCQVHFRADVYGTLYLLEFILAFVVAHIHDGFD